MPDENSSSQENRLITLGLNALARSPEMNYFADGHRGASMISAHLLCVDNKLAPETVKRIQQLFNLNWALQQIVPGHFLKATAILKPSKKLALH